MYKSILLTIGLLLLVPHNVVAETVNRNQADAPFAVVELFTSEGCSSCPPAESNLVYFTEKARTEGKRIFPIELHVDYWDYLGWKDPFAQNKFTQRQRMYAQLKRLSSIYTPHMIINGKHMPPGYDRKKAEKLIAEELQNPAASHLSLKLIEKNTQTIALDYSLGGKHQGYLEAME